MAAVLSSSPSGKHIPGCPVLWARGDLVASGKQQGLAVGAVMVAMHSRAQVPSFSTCASPCLCPVQGILPPLLTLPNEIIPGMTVEEISPPPYEHSSDEPLRKWELQPRWHSSTPGRQWESKSVRCFPPTAGHAGCLPPSNVPDPWQKRKLRYCLESRRNSCLSLFLPVLCRPSLGVESPAGS